MERKEEGPEDREFLLSLVILLRSTAFCTNHHETALQLFQNLRGLSHLHIHKEFKKCWSEFVVFYQVYEVK